MAECRRVHWRHLANTIELVLPSARPFESTTQTANPSVQPFLHSWRQKIYSRMGAWATISPIIAPSYGGSEPPSNTRFLGLIRALNPNGTSVRSAVFAQITTECFYTLQWDASFPLKIASCHCGIWTPSNTWFPGPTRVLNANGISIGSAVFAGLTRVTDRQTDRQTTLLGRQQ